MSTHLLCSCVGLAARQDTLQQLLRHRPGLGTALLQLLSGRTRPEALRCCDQDRSLHGRAVHPLHQSLIPGTVHHQQVPPRPEGAAEQPVQGHVGRRGGEVRAALAQLTQQLWVPQLTQQLHLERQAGGIQRPSTRLLLGPGWGPQEENAAAEGACSDREAGLVRV